MTDARFRNFTPATIRSYDSNLRRFHRFLQGHGASPETAGTNEFKAFLALMRDRGFTEETILNNFTSISSFYDYLAMEGVVRSNPVSGFRKRYLRKISQDRESHRSHPRRQVPDVDRVRDLVRSGMGKRDTAVLLVLLKTGIRRDELVHLNVEDVDSAGMRIRLHPHRKRANLLVFFDAECHRALIEWLAIRVADASERALFTNSSSHRLNRSGVYNLVVDAATRAGIHDPKSRRPEDRFGPHNCRHWFTSILLNAGMTRQFVQGLRGDHAADAVDMYFHPDEKMVRKVYDATMPTLGVYGTAAKGT